MRTRLALAAALPLVAVLAACSTGTGTGTGTGSPGTPAPTTSTSTGSPKAGTTTTTVDDGTHDGTTVAGHPHSTATPAVSHRPTEKDALDTVRSYMQREIGMDEPRTGPFRWTGKDTGEVDVRSVAGGERIPGPATTVSVRRLRTVWFVTGARTDGIRVDTASLAGHGQSQLRITGKVLDPGAWIVTVTQDRYGTDPVLADRGLVTRYSGRPDSFDQVLPFKPPTATTGSVIISELFPGGAPGVMRAVVIRVAFGPSSAAPSCAPSALLPVLRSWYDDPSVEARIAKLDVLRCRNGFAHVIVVPRRNPPGHNQLDSLEVYLGSRNERWHILDFGSSLECGSDKAIEQACRVLGYTD